MHPAKESGNDGCWRPLLTGRAADRAWRVIAEISDALESQLTMIARDPFLGDGTAGLALYFSYVAQCLDDDRSADIAMMFVERMLDDMTRSQSLPGLFGGFSGPAWLLEHLEGRLLEPDEDAQEERQVDEMLLALLQQGEWTGDYDLINGLVGFGTYALEARRRQPARQCLEQVVLQLDRLAEPGPRGIAWFTSPERLPDHQLQEFPQGYYNLGIAHGVPAIISLLGQIHASGLLTAQTRQLLEPAVRWLLAHEIDAESRFPMAVAEGVIPRSSRLAWCYGDPGVATALLVAARATGRQDWEREALRVAHHAAMRDTEIAGVMDAGLCHGAAGLGHVFNRLHQATGDSVVGEAACFWFDRCLDMQRQGEGVAGYSAWWKPNGETAARWTPLPGFLMGAAGLGLALLGAVTPIEPEWDRVLMTAIPSVAETGEPGESL